MNRPYDIVELILLGIILIEILVKVIFYTKSKQKVRNTMFLIDHFRLELENQNLPWILCLVSWL